MWVVGGNNNHYPHYFMNGTKRIKVLALKSLFAAAIFTLYVYIQQHVRAESFKPK